MKIKKVLLVVLTTIIALSVTGNVFGLDGSIGSEKEVRITASAPNPDFTKNEFTDTTARIPYHIWMKNPLKEGYKVGITYWSKNAPATTIFLTQEITCPREAVWTLKNLRHSISYNAIIFCSGKRGYFSSNVISFKTRAPDIVVKNDLFAMTGKDKFKVSGEMKNISLWNFIYVDVQVTTICKNPNDYNASDPEKTYSGSMKEDGIFCGSFFVNQADKKMDHWYRFIFYDKTGKEINRTVWTKFKIPS